MQLAIIGLGVAVGEVTARYQGQVACLLIFKQPISIDSNSSRLRRQLIYKKRGKQFLQLFKFYLIYNIINRQTSLGNNQYSSLAAAGTHP
jgi:hypothetical protein